MTPAFYDRPVADAPIATLSLAGEGFAAHWRLVGSPMVITLASRLFQVMPDKARTSVRFPAAIVNFDDLVMLQHRFPIRMDAPASVRWEGLRAARLASLAPAPARTAPLLESSFDGKLMAFQSEGLTFMAEGGRTLLADEMGLGKTPQSLALIAQEIGNGPAVVVCQPHLITHWAAKLRQFTPGLRVAVLKGKAHALPRADVYLVHYLNLSKWQAMLSAALPTVVVYDEAQEMRHSGTAKYRACKGLSESAAMVAGLSGTPIYNRGPEIWNIMDCLSPHSLGRRSAFEQEWCRKTYQGWVVEDPEALGAYLTDRRLMLRRRKESVMGELPPKRRVVESVTGDDAMFRRLVEESATLARRAEGEANPLHRARMEMEALEGTRRATGISKAHASAAFIRALMEAEEPTLVFAHHHAVQDILMQELAAFFPVRISGRETLAEKAASQEAFVDGVSNLCLIGLRAATGLDGLQERARVVVFAELDWSPAVHWQAEDRAHRYGQTDSVLCYYLVTGLGSDPFMLGALDPKKTQFDGLMRDGPNEADDPVLNAAAAEDHKARLLRMLRSAR